MSSHSQPSVCPFELTHPRRRSEGSAQKSKTLGLPRGIFAELIDSGSTVGGLLTPVAAELGVGSRTSVTAIGSHDTASAVAAIPATTPDFAYVSCGTWSLVGVELEHPVLTEASRLANFTNEGGVDGRIRYLRNVMGLWLLSESVRSWEAAGERIDLPALLAQAAEVTEAVPAFDPDDGRFLAPGDISERIGAWFGERGVQAPTSRAAIVRSILESLSNAYARAIRTAHELSAKTISVIHMVGGGAQNELLCQLTADRRPYRPSGDRRPGGGHDHRQCSDPGSRRRARRRRSRDPPSDRGPIVQPDSVRSSPLIPND